MARRLQQLEWQPQGIANPEALLLIKDNLPSGAYEDYKLKVDQFKSDLIYQTEASTSPLIGQIPRLIDTGTGQPALPAISARFLTDLDENFLPTGNGTTKGLVRLSDSLNQSSNVNSGTAATPYAVNLLQNAKASKAVNETISGNWHFTGSNQFDRAISLENTEDNATALTLKRHTQVGLKFLLRGSISKSLGIDNNGVLRFGNTDNHAANSEIWHSGNDGSGSGLDSDTLDSYHASAFPRKAEAAAITANWNFAGTQTFTNINTTDFTATNQITLTGGLTANEPLTVTHGTKTTTVTAVPTYGSRIYNNTDDKGLYTGSAGSDSPFWYNGSTFYKLLHTGKMGSGSGIDADKLDGVQGSSFLRTDADTTKTSGTLKLNDSVILSLGTDSDAQFYHTGGHLILKNSTGNFSVRNASATDVAWINQGGDFQNIGNLVTSNVYSTGGNYYGNNKSCLKYDGTILELNYGGSFTGGVRATGNFYAQAHAYIKGNIYGNTTSSPLLLKNQAYGQAIHLQTVNASGDTHTVMSAYAEGANTRASLRYNGQQKLTTTYAGVDIAGLLAVTGSIVSGTDLALNGEIQNNSGAMTLKNLVASQDINFQAQTASEGIKTGLVIRSVGENVYANLKYNGDNRLVTTPSGVRVYGDVSFSGSLVQTGDEGTLLTLSNTLGVNYINYGAGNNLFKFTKGASSSNHSVELYGSLSTSQSISTSTNIRSNDFGRFDGGVYVGATTAHKLAIASDNSNHRVSDTASTFKYGLWGNSLDWCIGMTSDFDYGDVTEWANTFTMRDDATGWIFRKSNHTTGQAAMSLSARGNMRLAKDFTIGGASVGTENRKLIVQAPANKNASLELVEEYGQHGAVLKYDGNSNSFLLRRRDNSIESTVMSFGRTSANVNFIGAVLAAGIGRFDGGIYIDGESSDNLAINSDNSYHSVRSVPRTDKYRLWGNSLDYTIGMTATYAYKDVTDYATTFTMLSDSQGWIFRKSSHTTGQAAMSLSGRGVLSVDNKVQAVNGFFDASSVVGIAPQHSNELNFSATTNILHLNYRKLPAGATIDHFQFHNGTSDSTHFAKIEAGTGVFHGNVVTESPTADNHATTKKYVDDAIEASSGVLKRTWYADNMDFGVTRTNNENYDIILAIRVDHGAHQQSQVNVDGFGVSKLGSSGSGTAVYSTHMVTVPAGSTYSITGSGQVSLSHILK